MDYTGPAIQEITLKGADGLYYTFVKDGEMGEEEKEKVEKVIFGIDTKETIREFYDVTEKMDALEDILIGAERRTFTESDKTDKVIEIIEEYRYRRDNLAAKIVQATEDAKEIMEQIMKVFRKEGA